MATLQSFYPAISIECPGVPVPVMEEAIRKGAREFCHLTDCIPLDVSIVTVVGTKDYSITVPADNELYKMVSIKRSASEALSPVKLDVLESMPDDTGDPTAFTLLETYPLSVRLYPTPNTIETLTAKIVLRPTQDATQVDDRLADWYIEGVTAYAKYWLMTQPAKPWSNPELAAFAYRQFDARVADTRVRRSQWRSDIPTSVSMNPFA